MAERISANEVILANKLQIAVNALEAILDEGKPRDNWSLQDYETAMRHDEHEARYALDLIYKGYPPVAKED